MHSESLENELEICCLAEANGSVGIPLDTYSEELSCEAEVRDNLYLYVIGIEEEVYATAAVDAPFDVQIRVGQGLCEA